MKNTVKTTAKKKDRYPRRFMNTVKTTAKKKDRYPRRFIKKCIHYLIYYCNIMEVYPIVKKSL
jgi:uncharacterized OsmC-like protein